MIFESLSQFYNSETWRKFRLNLIMERTGEDGILRCEYSGVSLFRSYDIVAHHKIPLTMGNVNDYNISLNPENVMMVSQKAHNEIHQRFGYVAERKVYYVYGAPGAGKTTFVNSIKGNSDIILDIDNIWECVTGKRYFKPAALNKIVFSIRDQLFDMIRLRVGRWERAFVIEGGAMKNDRDTKIKLLSAEPIFIDTDKNTCISRVATDENRTKEQRTQWMQYINEWFEEYEQ